VTDAFDIEPPGADLDVIEVIEQPAGDHRRLSFRGRQAPYRRQAPVEGVARREVIDRFGGVAGLAGMLVSPAGNAYEAWIGLEPSDGFRWRRPVSRRDRRHVLGVSRHQIHQDQEGEDPGDPAPAQRLTRSACPPGGSRTEHDENGVATGCTPQLLPEPAIARQVVGCCPASRLGPDGRVGIETAMSAATRIDAERSGTKPGRASRSTPTAASAATASATHR